MNDSSEKAIFYWPIRVYHEDIDSMRIVYYGNYLKFLERARTEWLRAAKINQSELHRETGVWLVVRSVNLDYLSSARLDDLLTVSVKIEERTRTSMLISQEIKVDDRLLLTATVRIVAVQETELPSGKPTLKAVAIPDPVLKALKEYL